MKKGNSSITILVVILMLVCIEMGAFIFINQDKLFGNELNKTNNF